ncbi:NUDIX domain-containing protein [Paracoccus sp. S-4012]|uniref:NUDIX hydrolase n=1 Tax=Paracoccus sp. S-4012 TaxID=2665648 RepID=UPI0012AF108A|nr:NUDIX hydrolase [Paracoccus sp. S-4012]MRX49675.1 NUDIX domain-containing protein [Paracoccus sp. S-4012]
MSRRSTGGRRRPATQVAALCVDPQRRRVLLITSRGTGRWVVPKGWPMRGKSLPRTAMQEAWEEAGVEGVVGKAELGRFHYDKLHDNGLSLPVEVRVFPLTVTGLASRFPEADQRRREWFSALDAAAAVNEDGLSELILALPRFHAKGLIPFVKAKKS